MDGGPPPDPPRTSSAGQRAEPPAGCTNSPMKPSAGSDSCCTVHGTAENSRWKLVLAATSRPILTVTVNVNDPVGLQKYAGSSLALADPGRS